MAYDSGGALREIQTALEKLDRPDVTIIAVSKTHPPLSIDGLAELGIRNFGENRYSEARDKFPEVRYNNPADPLIYHHIGPLQSGFARNLPGLFQWVHGASSVSSLEKLARAAMKYAQDHAEPSYLWPMKYLVQIRLTAEESKLGGMTEEEFLSLDSMPGNDAIQFRGFMTMGPESQDPVETREVFHRLRELRDRSLPEGELSMGMSGDWKIAVEEGATMIRLGSVLFGPRESGPWKKN